MKNTLISIKKEELYSKPKNKSVPNSITAAELGRTTNSSQKCTNRIITKQQLNCNVLSNPKNKITKDIK